MNGSVTIKRALISVCDKSGIIEFAQFLANNGVEIISTGKTYKVIVNAGINAIEVSDYTKSPEIMGGRVKTLHPKIHGGILGIRGEHGFADNPQIDLIVTNLYPFFEVVSKANVADSTIIENIDIGGVTLIRAAAKNFRYVCVITDINDYSLLKSTDTSLDFRRRLATKAFAVTAKYDTAIQQWFAKSEKFNNFFVGGQKIKTFRYGENPHQKAAFYSNDNSAFPEQIQGKELSYNNVMDAEAAYNLVLEFDSPTVAIIKHNNPCGVATDANIVIAYQRALNCDTISSFGGIVAVNHEITEELASEIIKVFTEVVIAPFVSEEARSIFARKPNLRILLADLVDKNLYNIKSAFGGILVQDEDKILISQDMRCVTKRKPSNMGDLLFAWKVCKHVKSNAIVICREKAILGIGAGQTSRVYSMRIAINKCDDLQGAVVASDAFFPFDDCVKLAAASGVDAIIQPGGSVRDKEVIKAADEGDISMIFTGMRHFKH